MLRLLLLRHAKSAWPAGIPDRDRPLGPRGHRAAPAMGSYLARENLIPAIAVVSPARRTLETFALASEDWNAPPSTIYEEAIYEAPGERLLEVLRTHGATSPLLMVGHNPGMEELARQLIAREERIKLPAKYPTGGLAVIDFEAADWTEVTAGSGRLERFVTPRSLGVTED